MPRNQCQPGAFFLICFFFQAGIGWAGQKAEGEKVQNGKTLPEWLKQLEKGAPKERVTAAKMLGKFDKKANLVLPALLKTINNDKESEVCLAALLVMKEMGVEAVPGWIDLLENENAEAFLRTEAARWLGLIGFQARAAVPALTKALKDKNIEVRECAAFALKGMGPAAKNAVPPLIDALKDSHAGVRHYAADALGDLENIRKPFLTCVLVRSPAMQAMETAIPNEGTGQLNQPQVVK